MNLDLKQTMVGAGVLWAGCLACLLCSAGCDAASPAGLAALEKAGPVRPVVDLEALTKAKLRTGPYRVVPDDLLELHVPMLMQEIVVPKQEKAMPLLCRVGARGTIRLPIVGEIKVSGLTLAEIETAVVKAYYPRYLKRLPSAAARVLEHHTERVCVVGAVNEPGTYELNSDEMSLVSALMKAGGIVPEGAAAIEIRPPGTAQGAKPLLLPIHGMNVPFADVALRGGEEVEVQRLRTQVFTVVGLVNKPGVFSYPADERYTLAHALAAAGGLDIDSDPKYVKLCRQDASGNLATVAFGVGGGDLSNTAGVPIKPGDVVAVERTLATDTRLLLLKIVRCSFGAGTSASYEFGR